MSQSPPPAGQPTGNRQPLSAYSPEGEWMEDDDDMEYEPTEEEDEEELEEYLIEEDDEEDEDYHDAEENVGDFEIELSMGEVEGSQEPEAGGAETETGQDGNRRTAGSGHLIMTREDIVQLLGRTGLSRIILSQLGGRGHLIDEDDDEEDGLADPYGGMRTRRRRRTAAARGDRFPKVPSETGRELMRSGVFGTNEVHLKAPKKRDLHLSARLLTREIGVGSHGKLRSANNLIKQNLIPSSAADTIVHYDDRCYSGQFSDDGNFFFSCAQDFKVRMYDTSNPYEWKYYKSVVYPYGQWTITDASLSPDNKYLAYSSIRSIVCLAPTDPGETGEPWLLDFSDMGDTSSRRGFQFSHFGIWSIRFSGDGREIVAGTSDRSVYVYDIESRRSILKIQGHEDDVNAVCFGDVSSPHILYSGSDDTTLKVWDRRSMADKRAAGIFLGHTEGLTYVDSKGDGRYILSNGKDQMMKLWDLRKMISTEKFDKERINPSRYSTGFDYRFMNYDDESYEPHPYDCSLVTFRGHRVLKTLIRCHFSPPGSTDSRYVYSGSEDGCVYIYNMDATLAGKVDVSYATRYTRPRDAHLYTTSYESTGRNGHNWKTCVRDASWHPYAPVIAATSWNGYGMSTGTCTLHAWNQGAEEDEGDPEMGRRVNDKLEYDEDLYGTTRSMGRAGYRTRLRTRRTAADDSDDE